jgi:hypothetical protein
VRPLKFVYSVVSNGVDVPNFSSLVSKVWNIYAQLGFKPLRINDF